MAKLSKLELEKYKKAQGLAKETMNFLEKNISMGDSEKDIASAACGFILPKENVSFWYHGVGALVLVGSRTILSVSGKNYVPSTKKLQRNDVVTIDLGPALGSYWGDFARTIVIEDGKVVHNAKLGSSKKIKELFRGVSVEKALHNYLIKIASPNMTFNELFNCVNEEISNLGCENLDFRKNLGHSIEKKLEDRQCIEAGNIAKLSSVKLFSFEPHIKKKHGSFGYKMEDLYYFLGKKLRRV